MKSKQVLEFIASLDGWLSSHEGFFLYELAQNAAKKGEVVEIGSWMGKSTICLAAGLQQKGKTKVFAIDPHKGEYSGENGIGKSAPTYKQFLHNIKKAGLTKWVDPVVLTSEKAAKKWEKSIQILFIDGLHDYKNTKLDFSLWSPFIVKNGTIAFHDAFCGHRGPEKIVTENILFNNNWNDIGVVGSVIYARKGKITTFPQWINIYRHRLLIPLAISLNKTKLPKALTFFVIHRVIKILLLNSYTFRLLFEK